jgi:hypothetical protein
MTCPHSTFQVTNEFLLLSVSDSDVIRLRIQW